MKQMEELIETLTEQLESKFRSVGTSGNMPRIPMLILYMGKTASKGKSGITNTLRKVWRKRADGIKQMAMDETSFCKISQDSGALEKISIQMFQQEIDELYAKEDCFYNMNDFFLCMIFDTRDYESIEAFKQCYEKVEEIKNHAGQSYCLTMSIVMLDESTSGNGLSKMIKKYLQKHLENQTMPYRSTVILSNRLYNGSLLRGERMKENYELAGNILLLANSISDTYSVPISVLFPTENKAYYLTAAYSKVNRPNRKICEVMLHTVLMWLENQLTEGNGLSLDEICQRLEITGGKSKLISTYFDKEISPDLPTEECLEHFPRISKQMEKHSKSTFKNFDDETMGAAELFYQEEFYKKMDCASLSFETYFRDVLFRKIKASEINNSLSETMINNVLSQMQVLDPDKELKAYQYLLERTKIEFIKKILPICRVQLQNLKKRSKEYIQQLSDLIQEFREGFFIDSDDKSVKSYYEGLTKHFLESPNGEQFAQKFSENGGDKENILWLLKEVIETIISENPVFMMPLVEEMTIRMGQNPTIIQQTLQNELMGGISDKIRLRTLTSVSMLQEIFIVNKKNEESQNTLFFNYLKQLKEGQANVRFFDSENSNSVGVIRLYQCDASSLI